MPIHEVNTPDGKVIKVEAPEGASENDILAFAAQNYQPSLEEEPDTGFTGAFKAGTRRLYGEAALTGEKLGLLEKGKGQKIYEEQEAAAQKAFKPTEEGWTQAPFLKARELLGGSLPYVAAPLAAAAIPEAAIPAAIAGTVASGAQFVGTNLARQLEEGKKEGKDLSDTSLLSAGAAAVPQAILDTVAFKMTPLIGNIFSKAGVKITDQTADQIAKKALLSNFEKSVVYQGGKAATAEGLTETGQQLLERLQAGLDITDEEARKEYFDSFIGGAVLGAGLGVPGHYVNKALKQRGENQYEDLMNNLRSSFDTASEINPDDIFYKVQDLTGEQDPQKIHNFLTGAMRRGDIELGQREDGTYAATFKQPDLAQQEQDAVQDTNPDVYTQEVRQSADKLREQMLPQMKKWGLENVGLKLMDSIENGRADGVWANKIIHVALNQANPMGTLRHEAIHALKELGGFKEDEWKALTNKAKSEWLDRFISKEQYENYKQQYEKDYGNLDGFDDYINEEAIAEAFKHYANTKPPAGLIGNLYHRLKEFFASIRNGFAGAGFTTPESVFRSIESGRREQVKIAEEALTGKYDLKPDTRRLTMDYKQVTERVPELQEGMRKLEAGEITAQDYDALVNKYKPILPYDFVPEPATKEEAINAVEDEETYGLPSKTLKNGHPVGLRLDIPAYSRYGVWVPTIHEQASGFGAGKKIGHESVAAVTDAKFGMSEKAAASIAGGKPKGTIATIKGNWKKITPKQAVAQAQEALNSPEWTQVGMDPERHSYFYDRTTTEPIVSADEVIQIGPLVLAKNPVYAPKSAFKYALSDIGHKREKTSGRYVGAPDWVGSNPRQLVELRKKLAQLVQEGESGKYWYEKSSKAILELTGGDKKEAEKFVGLIAIYSPNATVAANTSMALNAYYQYKAGLPIKAGFGDANRKAEDLLRHNKEWGGIKTNSFYQNLMVEIDESKVPKDKATMDMWMALAFDYGSKTLDQGPKYEFSQREIKLLADKLGWKPHQVQAAIWTAIKARIEGIRGDLKTQELASGIGREVEKIDPETKKTKLVYEVLPNKKYDHFKLAHKLGMAAAYDQAKILESKYDFSDALDERAAQMSWEATPGATSGILPGLLSAQLDQKFEYLTAISKALTDKNGVDLIAKRIGLPSGKGVIGFSAWQGDIGAGAQTFTPVALKGSGEKRDVTPESRNLLNLYCAIKGYVLAQEAVVWHVPVFNGSVKNQNGIEASFNRPLNNVEMEELYNKLHKKFGTWEIAPAYTPTGFRLLNFTNIDNKTYHKGVEEILQSMPEDFGGGIIEFDTYRSVGDYISNDWKADPLGEGYARQIESSTVAGSATQRSDLQAWSNDLRSNIETVNEEFSNKYGWGKARFSLNPTNQRFALALESLQPDSFLVSNTHPNNTGNLAYMPSSSPLPQLPIRMTVGTHDDRTDKGYGAKHILKRITKDPTRAPEGITKDLLENLILATEKLGSSFTRVYQDPRDRSLMLFDPVTKNKMVVVQRPDHFAVTTIYNDPKTDFKYGKPVWTGQNVQPTTAEYLGKPTGIPVVAQGADIVQQAVPTSIKKRRIITPNAIQEEGDKNRYALRAPDTKEFKEFFKDTKVVNDEGKPLPMYHGTAGDLFTVFDKEKIRLADYDTPFNGFWFSSDKNTSPAMKDAKNVIPVFLNIKNPAPSEVWRKVSKDVYKESDEGALILSKGSRSESDEIRNRLQSMGYDGVHYMGKPSINKNEFEKNGYTSFKSLAGKWYTIDKNEENGGIDLYSGKVSQKPNYETEEFITGYLDLNDFLNTFSGEEIWVAFEPNQIKSVTNQKPTTSADIRYSLRAPQTEEFREWFGDSKIVNKDGSPKVYYHGTARDITEFKPKQANAIFLTDNPVFAGQFSQLSENTMHRMDFEALPEKTQRSMMKKAITMARADKMITADRAKQLTEINNRETLPADWYISSGLSDILEHMMGTESGQNIIPLFVKANSPFDYENKEHIEKALGAATPKETQLILQRASYNPNRLRKNIGFGSWVLIESPEFQSALKRAGFDAFYVSEGGNKNLAVYNPNQVKSFSNFAPTESPDIRYALPNAAPQDLTKLTPANTAGQRLNNAIDNVQSAWHDNEFWTGLRNAWIDPNSGLTKRLQNLPIFDAKGQLRADMLARAKSQTINIIRNGLQTGIPVLNNDGSVIIREDKVNNLAHSQILADRLDNNVYVKQSGKSGRGFVAEIARALRGEEIMKEDDAYNKKNKTKRNRERQVTPEQIAWAHKQLQNVPEVQDIFDIWKNVNTGLLDLWENVGLIDTKYANELRSKKSYVSLAASFEDLETMMEKTLGYGATGLKSTGKVHELKGAEYLRDKNNNIVKDEEGNPVLLKRNIWENIDKQYASMLAAAYNNQVRKVAFSQLQSIGAAKIAPSQDKANLRFKDHTNPAADKKGVVHAVVENPTDLAAFESMHYELNPIMKAMGFSTRLLRAGALLNPMFWIKQLIRDPIHASLVANSGIVTPFHSAREFMGILIKDTAEAKILAARGVIGPVDTTMDLHTFLEQVGEEKVNPNALDKMLHQLMRIHEMSDAATRIAIFKKERDAALARGLSQQEAEDIAVYKARESINFMVHGNSKALNYLRQSIPFFSAAVTSLDTVYRAATGYGLPPKEKAEAKRLFKQRALMVIIASTAYAMLMQDDDEYKKQPDWIKDNNWLIKNPLAEGFIKVPVPYEIGFLFKTIPEAAVRYMYGTSTGKEVVHSYYEGVTNNLPGSALLIPQAFKPIIEVMTNHSFYTGSTIESMGDVHLPVEMRGRNASEISKMLSKAGLGQIGLSPAKIDFLTQGYMAELGTFSTFLADGVINTATGKEPPSTNLAKLPFFKSFMTDPNADKAVADFYNLEQNANAIAQQFSQLKARGLFEEAKEFVADEEVKRQIVAAPILRRIGQSMTDIRKQLAMVENNQSMSPDERRELINKLTAQYNRVAQQGYKVAEAAQLPR